MHYGELSNKEVARRLIKNFLKAHPDKESIDFIREQYCLNDTSSFIWVCTPEGGDFWDEFFEFKCLRENSKVYDFLKKYFFVQQKDFINLEYVLV